MAYHVLNRGNGRAEVFHKEDDYAAFLELLCQASERLPMRLLSYCLMPNHFHLVLWPWEDDVLSMKNSRAANAKYDCEQLLASIAHGETKWGPE